MQSMAVFAANGSLPDHSGGSRPVNSISTSNNLRILTELFGGLQPAKTLEIGLAFGASATLLLDLHRQAGHVGVCHHAIDPLQESLWGGCGLLHLEQQGLRGGLDLHACDSSLALPRLLERGERFGLIYIDGSHRFDDVMVDFFFAHRLLEVGGVMVLDDYSDVRIAKVVRYLRRNHGSEYDELSPYAITDPSRAWIKSIAAQLLGRQQTVIFRKVSDPPMDWSKPLVDF